MTVSSAPPEAVSDTRLSSPEPTAPDAPSAALQARRLKLRRIVAWVVGGATLLMCAGLVRAAIGSHTELAALEAAQGRSAPSEPIAPSAVAVQTADLGAAAPPVAPPGSAVASTSRPAKKGHAGKGKHSAVKAVNVRH